VCPRTVAPFITPRPADLDRSRMTPSQTPALATPLCQVADPLTPAKPPVADLWPTRGLAPRATPRKP